MAWWQGGYREFHDCDDELHFASRFARSDTPRCAGPSKPPPPASEVFACPSCRELFRSFRELVDHAGRHRALTPHLLLDGRRAPGLVRIGETVAADRWHIIGADQAILDGRTVAAASIGDAIREFDAPRRHLLELSGAGTTERFEFEVRLAKEEDLAQVDGALHDLILSERLDVSAVERFIDAAGPRGTGAHYLDGIVQYLFWALGREGALGARGPTGSGEERLNRAVDELKVFDRWYARAIRSLAAFHYNQFDQVINLAVDERLREAAGFYADLAAGRAGEQLGGAWAVGEHASATFSDVGVESQLLAVNSADLVSPHPDMKEVALTDRDRVRELVLQAELHRRHEQRDDFTHTLEQLRQHDRSATWATVLKRRADGER